MTDDTSITRFAQHYRLEAAAVLVQIAKDETAPPAARQAAAEKILAYSDGRPGIAKQITIADLELMDDEQRQQLLHALLTRYETELPGAFKAMMQEAYTEALAREAGRPRFTRGERPTLIAQPITRRSHPSSLKEGPAAMRVREGACAHGGQAMAPAGTGEVPSREFSRNALSSARAEVTNSSTSADLPAPYGHRFGLAELLPNTAPTPTNPAPVNGIHHSVLERSARPNPGMAIDVTWRDYRR